MTLTAILGLAAWLFGTPALAVIFYLIISCRDRRKTNEMVGGTVIELGELQRVRERRRRNEPLCGMDRLTPASRANLEHLIRERRL